METKGMVRVPWRFFTDHEERGLDTPEVVRKTTAGAWVRLDDPALPELLNDAEHYADSTGGPDMAPLGVVASARATVRAIRAAMAVQS